MASIEFIKKRIDGKNKEIAKLEKKLERIRKVEASGWDDDKNPYYYSESDLKWTIRDLEEAKEALAKWEADLATAMEKAASRNVQAIIQFLEMWKERCFKFYHDGLTEYYKEKEEVWRLGRECEELSWGSPEYNEAKEKHDAAYKAFYQKKTGYFEEWEKERGGRMYRGRTKVKEGEYLLRGGSNLEDVCEKLNLPFKSDDSDTVGGFVLELLGHVPEEGEKAETEEGFVFTVEKMDLRKLELLRLTFPQPFPVKAD